MPSSSKQSPAALSMLVGLQPAALLLVQVAEPKVTVRQERLQAELIGDRCRRLEHAERGFRLGCASVMDQGQQPAGIGLGATLLMPAA